MGPLVVRLEGSGLRQMTDQKPDEPDWRHVMAREDAHRAHDLAASFTTQVNEAAVKTGESTFRACLLINGGAAVSVLAFIGGLASKDVIGVSQLAAGVVAAVAGLALSYFANYFTAVHAGSLTKIWEHPWLTPGKRTVWLARLKTGFHVLAILAGVVSVFFFVRGILAVRNSVEHIPPATHTQAPSAKPSP